MYVKGTQTVHDRREMLRVKIKSLMEEARIIRREAARVGFGPLREELHLHRVRDVRSEARAAHIAYALVRGKPYDSVEPWRMSNSPALWERVKQLVKKYGPAGMVVAAPDAKDLGAKPAPRLRGEWVWLGRPEEHEGTGSESAGVSHQRTSPSMAPGSGPQRL